MCAQNESSSPLSEGSNDTDAFTFECEKIAKRHRRETVQLGVRVQTLLASIQLPVVGSRDADCQFLYVLTSAARHSSKGATFRPGFAVCLVVVVHGVPVVIRDTVAQ